MLDVVLDDKLSQEGLFKFKQLYYDNIRFELLHVLFWSPIAYKFSTYLAGPFY